MFAWEEAISFWQAALELLEESGVAPEQWADVAVPLGQALWDSASAPEAVAQGFAYLEAALERYTDAGQPLAAARVHIEIGRKRTVTGEAVRVQHFNLDRGREHFQAAAALLGDEGEPALLVALSVGLAGIARRQVRVEDALAASSQAMQAAERAGDAGLWAEAAAWHGWGVVGSGRLGEGLALLDRAWTLADRHKTVNPTHWTTMHLRDITLYVLGNPRAAQAWQRRELNLTSDARRLGAQSTFLTGLFYAHCFAGELEASMAAAGAVDADYPRPGSFTEAGEALQRGDRAASFVDMEVANWERFLKAGDHWLPAIHTPRNARGRAGWDEDRADQLLQEALAIATEGHHIPLELGVRAELALFAAEHGNRDLACDHLARCRAITAAGEDWQGLGGRLALAEAAFAAREGRLSDAAPCFERALASFREYTLPWDEADAHRVWGRFLADSGQRHAAEAQFDAALAVYQRIGAGAGWLEQVASLRAACLPNQRSATLSPPSSSLSPSYPDGLSEREVEVLRLLAAGKTNQEIAGVLVISLNTVLRHVTHILTKTGAANRTEAAAYAHRQGLA